MYKHSFILGLISIVLTGSHALASESRPHVTFTGYGPVRIGMSLQALRAALGDRLVDDPTAEDSCRYLSQPSHAGIFYMVIDGRVARIDVSAPSSVEALSGGHVGMSKASMLHVYPSISVTRHFYDEAGSYLTLLSKDKRYGIRFEVEAGKVVRYYAGRADAIQYVEGCE